jgi:hypothetical protein
MKSYALSEYLTLGAYILRSRTTTTTPREGL